MISNHHLILMCRNKVDLIKYRRFKACSRLEEEITYDEKNVFDTQKCVRNMLKSYFYDDQKMRNLSFAK